MFLQAKRVFAAVLFAALVTLSGFGQSTPSNSFEGIQIELPASGRIRIENQFGGVAAEVWKEKYVSVSATIEGTRSFAGQLIPSRELGSPSKCRKVRA